MPPIGDRPASVVRLLPVPCWVFDLQHDCVWRHRAPSGREYSQRDEIAEAALPLPMLAAEISLAGLF